MPTPSETEEIIAVTSKRGQPIPEEVLKRIDVDTTTKFYAVDQARDDHGRFEDEGKSGVTEAERPHVERLVEAANAGGRELRIALDKNGNKIAEVIGKQLPKEWDKPSEEAAWDTDEKARAVLASEGYTDMHSHPEQIGPSDGDWGYLGTSSVGKIVIAEKGGKVWTIEKTPEWGKIPWQERTPNALRKAYNDYLDSITDYTAKSTEEMIADASRHMAKKFGVKMTETKSVQK